jgi:hypothetical protein
MVYSVVGDENVGRVGGIGISIAAFDEVGAKITYM